MFCFEPSCLKETDVNRNKTCLQFKKMQVFELLDKYASVRQSMTQFDQCANSLWYKKMNERTSVFCCISRLRNVFKKQKSVKKFTYDDLYKAMLLCTQQRANGIETLRLEELNAGWPCSLLYTWLNKQLSLLWVWC